MKIKGEKREQKRDVVIVWELFVQLPRRRYENMLIMWNNDDE